MQRKSLVVVLLLVYTAVVSWIGYLGADPGVAQQPRVQRPHEPRA